MRKIALITGVTSGIGKALAAELIQEGWVVIGIGRSIQKLEMCKSEFKENFFPVLCDLSHALEIQKASALLREKNLVPHLFILNAGIGEPEEYGTLSMEKHEKVFRTNYFGILHWIQEWLPDCLLTGGTFVGITSVLARQASGATAYCASKAAVKSAFESFRLKYADSPIKFITVFPGPVDTPLLKMGHPTYPPFTVLPNKAAKIILKAVRKNKPTLTFPFFYKILFAFFEIMPEKIAYLFLK